ncbi:MAG: hypothetical protein AAF999_14605 [Pseudomonadota bacterium]
MRPFRSIIVGALIASATAVAAELEQVVLDPIPHADATLVVLAPDGSETSYTPSQLEQFTTYRMTTKTPWRETPATFEGVLLSDVLEAHGLAEMSTIVVTAENDYSTSISRDVIGTVEILVATRVDGKAHSRRARGPIQFVIDAAAYEASGVATESDLVWMAARIEPAD